MAITKKPAGGLVKVIFIKTGKNLAYWPGDRVDMDAEKAVELAEAGVVEIVESSSTTPATETATDTTAEAATAEAKNRRKR